MWPPSPLDQTTNILMMGKDQRPDDGAWRTDTIMIVAVDQKANQVGVISVPRDLYVEIPGMGLGRINQADYFGETSKYPGGGPALLRRVLTETLGIPTQRYVRIEYDGLSRLVDALGGVTVTLDCPLYERTPNDSSPNGVVDWNLPAGPVGLDGATAKKFATYRYATTDYGRARRQQQLIWAIRDRVLQIDALPRIPDLWKALSNMFSTDLGLLDVVKLAGLGASLQPDRVHGLVLGDDVMDYFITPEGAWVVVISDYDRIAAEKEQLFTQRPLASFNVSTGSQTGGCPPPPTPPPVFTQALPAANSHAHTSTILRHHAKGGRPIPALPPFVCCEFVSAGRYFLSGEVCAFGVGSGDTGLPTSGSDCFCCLVSVFWQPPTPSATDARASNIISVLNCLINRISSIRESISRDGVPPG